MLSFAFIILATLGTIVNPDLATYGTLVLIPLWIAVRRPVQGALGSMWAVRIEPGSSDILVILALFFGPKVFSLPRLPITFAFLAFQMISIFQISIAVDLGAGLKFASVSLYLMLTAFVIRWHVDSNEQYVVLRDLYLLSAYITAAVLLLSFALTSIGLGNIVQNLMYGVTNDSPRPMAFFKDANVAGPFVASAFLYLLNRLLFQVDRWNIRSISVMTILAAAVGVTFSRGALINLAVGILFLAWFAAGSWRQRVRWLVVASIFVGSGYLASKTLFSSAGQGDRFQVVNSYDSEGRFVSWEAGIQTFLEHPMGVGPGQYETYSADYQNQIAWNSVVTPSAHSTIMRLLMESGTFGLLTMLFFFWLIFRMGQNILQTTTIRNNVFIRHQSVWALAALTGTLAESILIDTLHWRHLWVIAGLVLALHKLQFDPIAVVSPLKTTFDHQSQTTAAS
jgi:O-antigen ligase